MVISWRGMSLKILIENDETALVSLKENDCGD